MDRNLMYVSLDLWFCGVVGVDIYNVMIVI